MPLPNRDMTQPYTWADLVHDVASILATEDARNAELEILRQQNAELRERLQELTVERELHWRGTD